MQRHFREHRKRTAKLSIAHNSGANLYTEEYVGQSVQTSPDVALPGGGR